MQRTKPLPLVRAHIVVRQRRNAVLAREQSETCYCFRHFLAAGLQPFDKCEEILRRYAGALGHLLNHAYPGRTVLAGQVIVEPEHVDTPSRDPLGDFGRGVEIVSLVS